ncbi:Amino acid ABC transporter, permease protein,3-TM domain, His/Glu/Gln/Arg/opine family [Moorella glycerini]|uniref:Glutamine transport system permease protein GlnP n=1 Tax=Neomoorella stamsii TaxID=1266720 RepID=A0A9X7J1B0_9FIRM|nr:MULTISPECIES: amino acid ABC transporter permease [Moorella]PRR71441.1 Glutamine transport system permease protein GlnP [Moorella stamsii]CEP68650.1 Amino acid ABC transporter, permease protein,3-TM domain, His/Glu/Gln/Arg/opine family [Moorella glycerini]
MGLVIQSLPYLLLGAVQTLKITLVAVSLGCVFGLIAGMGRLSRRRLTSFLATCYVDFFRGTPLLVQIFIVYYGFPQLLNEGQQFLMAHFGLPQLLQTTHIPVFVAATVSTSLNSGAYVAEIFRAGIQSIERGQVEAARSLGMTERQTMRYIVLPQAFKRVIPPLGNEFIAMLKDTSLLSVIGYVELTRQGQLISAATFRPLEVFFAVALIYLVMTFTISRLVDYLERRLRTGDHDRS